MSDIPSNKPVRIKDVYNALGIEGGSRGRDLGYACSNAHGRTNKWARFKPVVVDTPLEITEAQRRAVSYGLYPMLDGAEAPGYTGGVTPTMQNILALSRLTWGYRAPQAGQWLRLTDWPGYEHRAAAPMTPPGDISVMLNETRAELRLMNNQIITTGNLTPEDFPWTSGKYLCVAVWQRKRSDGTTTLIGYKTAAGTLGTTTGRSVTFDKNEFPSLQGYTLHYLMCLNSREQTTALNAGGISDTRLYPLVCDTAPTGEISISRDSPLAFTGDRVAHHPTDTPKSISLYSLAETTGARCLATGADGTVTIFGTLKNAGTKTLTLAQTRPVEATLRPSLSSAQGGTVRAEIWTQTGGAYALNTTAITIAPGATLAVALRLPGIGRMAGGSTAAATQEWTFASLRLGYVNASSADEDGFMWGRSIYICAGTDDKEITFDPRVE